MVGINMRTQTFFAIIFGLLILLACISFIEDDAKPIIPQPEPYKPFPIPGPKPEPVLPKPKPPQPRP